MGGLIGSLDVNGSRRCDELQQAGIGVFGNDTRRRGRSRKQSRLGKRFLATANDGYGFAVDPHEDREGVELGIGLRHGDEQ